MKEGRGIAALLLIVAFALAGCAGSPMQHLSLSATHIQKDHSLIQQGAGNYAAVYFIRPDTERYMGAADNRLAVELNKELLINLVKSEYILSSKRVLPISFRLNLLTVNFVVSSFCLI